jgi:hypothetical protein
MDKEILLVVIGGLVALVSATLTTIINYYLDLRRSERQQAHQLRTAKREFKLTALKEQFEPALDLMSEAVEIIVARDDTIAKTARQRLEALSPRYWAIWLKLRNEEAQGCLDTVIQYAHIEKGEEQWGQYQGRLLNATQKLTRLYALEQERLFNEG